MVENISCFQNNCISKSSFLPGKANRKASFQKTKNLKVYELPWNNLKQKKSNEKYSQKKLKKFWNNVFLTRIFTGILFSHYIITIIFTGILCNTGYGNTQFSLYYFIFFFFHKNFTRNYFWTKNNENEVREFL